MGAQSAVRASGRSPAEEATREASKEADRPVEPELDVDRRKRFRTTSFARMPLDWSAEDKMMVARIHRTVEKRIQTEFADLLDLWYELLARVREFEYDPDTGAVIPDEDGYPRFRRTSTGAFVENWERITGKERERYIFQITTNLVDWQQRAARMWAEAMFAKAQWEEAYGLGFESIEGAKATIQDREARAKIESSQKRYFAIYVSYYSRVADGYVRSIETLGQRMKDVHVAASGRA